MRKRKLKRKIKRKIIFLVIIILLVGGFFINRKTDFVTKIKDEINNTDNGEEVKNPAKEILKEEDVKSKEKVKIETPSGAVLVGSIKRDSEGWYFMSIQPLDITLTYYIDHPEKFENVIKLRMLEDNEDNFNKSIYNNEIVTVYGEILNPRSMGTLYLYPYNIKSGKQVIQSYADASITAPSDIFGTMDENLLPSKMNSKIVNGEYKYNFYMVSKETLYRFDNDFIDFYLEFVDAFLNYKTSIKCPNKNYADFLFSILDYQFPVFFADGIYDFSKVYDKDSKTINWSYSSNSKTEHDKLISNFEKEANKFLNGVTENLSDSKKAQIIYHNLSKAISYNYNSLNDFKNTESYYVYVNHSGICHSFAYTYNQLLTQVGIESTIAIGQAKGASIGHAWSVIKIDGTYYFADPTYELSYKNGTAYKFYGMGIKERESTNEYYEDNIVIGMYDSKPMKNYGNFDKNLPILE